MTAQNTSPVSVPDTARLRENLCAVIERLTRAAARGGNPVPRLIAVTKSCDDMTFRALISEGIPLGIAGVGENRARQCAARTEMLTGLYGVHAPAMHFIGTLQPNKVKYIIGRTALIHSLDSLSVAAELERLAIRDNIRVDVTAEVNSGREDAKGGIMPEALDDFVAEVADRFPHLSLVGLMTMAPRCAMPEDYRPYFRETKAAFDRLRPCFHTDTPVLSMGMTDSYEVAAEEGATLVRVGRALFL